MALAGRCECGVRLDLAAQDPDFHLVCRQEKRCAKCQQVKPWAEFYRYTRGLHSRCKPCTRIDRKRQYHADEKYREGMKTARRERYWANKPEIVEERAKKYARDREKELKRKADYRKENRELLNARARKFYREHREYELKRYHKWANENREKLRERYRIYYAKNRDAILARERDRNARKKAEAMLKGKAA